MRKFLAVILTMFTMFAVVGSANATTVEDSPYKDKATITWFYYNARGADTLANRNQEAVYVKNVSDDNLNVTGWKVHDSYQNHNDDYTNAFVVPKLNGVDVVLAPGESFMVTPASGVNFKNGNSYSFYFNFTSKGYNGHVWNNLADIAYLKDADDKLVHSKSYNFKNGYYVR